ncbi:MAG: hypothetical protein ACR2PO_11595 [Methyloligellaceae bacterium]
MREPSIIASQTGNATDPVASLRAEDVRSEVLHILESQLFSRADNLSRFLRFVVDGALEGRSDLLKAYTIGTEVFGRPASFDPNTDPIVRVQAANLRRRLDLYYSSEGRTSSILIRIPKGSYVPEIRAAEHDPRRGPNALRAQPQATEDFRGLGILISPFACHAESVEARKLAAGLPSELAFAFHHCPLLEVWWPDGSTRERPSGNGTGAAARNGPARIALRGSVAQCGTRLSIVVWCVDQPDDRIIWMERFRYDIRSSATLDMQEDIAGRTSGALANTFSILHTGSAVASSGLPIEVLEPYELFVQVNALHRGPAPRRLQRAKHACAQAASVIPHLYVTWYMQGWVGFFEHAFFSDPGDDGDAILANALTCVRRSLELKHDNVMALAIGAGLHLCSGQHQLAREYGERAVALMPYKVPVLMLVGLVEAFSGDWDAGLARLERMKRIDMSYPRWILFVRVLHDLHRRDAEAALSTLAGVDLPDFYLFWMLRALCHGHLGQQAEAAHCVRRLVELQPDADRRWEGLIRRFGLPGELADYGREGLRRAGLSPARPIPAKGPR